MHDYAVINHIYLLGQLNPYKTHLNRIGSKARTASMKGMEAI